MNKSNKKGRKRNYLKKDGIKWEKVQEKEKRKKETNKSIQEKEGRK